MTPLDLKAAEFDRAQVLAWVEEATHASLSANDPLPDTLIACAQSLDLTPAQLRLWVYDQPKIDERGDWTCEALAKWAHRPRIAGRGDEEDCHG